MNILELTQDIYYVGVNDRTTSLFEGLWSLPNGVSYNSYIVKGDKIALIDTVHISQALKFLANIKDIIGDKEIDYLVINHMEPDHSGAMEMIIKTYPNIKIVGNKKTADMISGFYGITDNVVEIKDGDVIDLGNNKSLTFALTPMVHWPETMVTFEQSSGTLFSGDAFGCYGALNGGIIDTEIEVENYIPEMYRYYATIVAKYGIFVQKAITKLKGLSIQRICSTHGPVWTEYMMHVIDLYDRLSRNESEKGVVIAYGSMYGNTEELAEKIARQLTDKGIRDIKIYNTSTADLSFILSDICRYKGLIIGCPTYSNGIFPPVELLLNAINTREMKNKVLACFGSFAWAPGITKKISSYGEKLNFNIINEKPEVKFSPNETNISIVNQMVDSFIAEFNS